MKEQLRQKLLEQIGSSVSASEHLRPTPRKQIRPTGETGVILVIDDEPSCLEFTATVLENNGYHVLSGQSVAEGKSLLQMIPGVTLVITDLKMPREDGFSFLEYLGNTIRYCHLPVIVLTCCTNQNIILKAVELGARDYLIKPFTAELLLTRVKRVCERRKGNILLITDNDQTILILRRTLMADGFRVSATRLKSEVEELLGREQFDVAICELILQDQTGLDLMITARDKGHYLPFLFVADSIVKLTDEDIRSSGGFGLIKKPFNNSDVLRAVASAIARNRRS